VSGCTGPCLSRRALWRAARRFASMLPANSINGASPAGRVESYLTSLTATSRTPGIQYLVVTPVRSCSYMPVVGRISAVGFLLTPRQP
jgi:hypothetical protein